jgi:hypothetical protein
MPLALQRVHRAGELLKWMDQQCLVPVVNLGRSADDLYFRPYIYTVYHPRKRSSNPRPPRNSLVSTQFQMESHVYTVTQLSRK